MSDEPSSRESGRELDGDRPSRPYADEIHDLAGGHARPMDPLEAVGEEIDKTAADLQELLEAVHELRQLKGLSIGAEAIEISLNNRPPLDATTLLPTHDEDRALVDEADEEQRRLITEVIPVAQQRVEDLTERHADSLARLRYLERVRQAIIENADRAV